MIRFSRHTLLLLSRLILGLMLTIQMVQAAQACALPEFKPSLALSEQAMPSDCQGQDGMGKNACLAHCLQADQSASKAGSISADQAYVPGDVLATASVSFHLPRAPGTALHRPLTALAATPPYLRFLRLLN